MPGQVEKAANARAAEKDVAATQALTLRQAIKASESQFALALPKHIDAGRFLRASLTALGTVEHLPECTQQSVLAGLMQAAQLGLEVSDVRGQCFLIPRKNSRRGGVYEATFQLGYRGMIDLAARSGIDVAAEEIREHDDYDFSLGTNRFLRHKPPLLKPRGEAIAYYATASFADGRTPAFTVMSRIEMEEHRDRFASSRDYNTKEIKGPWVEHFDAMARKTVIRALLNYLPVAIELRETVNRAEAVDAQATDLGSIDHSGGSFVVPELDVPDGIDTATGEIDTLDVTETTDDGTLAGVS